MVRRSIWHSERLDALASDAERYLFFYFLTCPHQTASGCMVLLDAYALGDLNKRGADWSLARYHEVRAALVKSELICHDQTTSEILITRWWQDNGPNNESWFAGAKRQCEAIRSDRLRKAALDALKSCWDEFMASKVPMAANVSKLRNGPEITPDERWNALGVRPRTAVA
jgi:hypothetical protein